MEYLLQQLPVKDLIRLAVLRLLVLAFTLPVIITAGAVQNPQPGQLSQNQQVPPVKKMKQTARKVSDCEILEARELLDHLGYWVNLDVNGNDASLRHALIAFQKIEDRERTGVLNIIELEALRVAQIPQVLETGYPHIEIDLFRQVLYIV